MLVRAALCLPAGQRRVPVAIVLHGCGGFDTLVDEGADGHAAQIGPVAGPPVGGAVARERAREP